MNAVDRLAAAPHWHAADPPRIPPGGLPELGLRTMVMLKAAGWASGAGDVALLRILGRNPAVFHGYLRFATALVPRGRLGRADTELVTLRSTWNIGGWYEFFHHIYLSRSGGLSIESVERVALGPDADGWNDRQRALLTAADELYEHRMISDRTFAALAAFLDEGQIVELCVLVGHYEMLGMLLKSAGVVPEPGAWRRGPLRWVRPADDTDSLLPAWLPAFNKIVTNRIQGPLAPYLPPYGVIVHRGRKSGRQYRTPVLAFRSGDKLVVPLPYGDGADWVRNLRAADRGGLERLGRLHRIRDVRVSDLAADGDLVPAPVRPLVRLVKILVATVEES